VPKDGSSANGPGGSLGQTGPRSEASANDDKVKPDKEKGLEEVAAEKSKVPGKKIGCKIEAKTSSQQSQN
jgi:hypothetical protein